MPLICLFLNVMFASQGALKVLLDLNKETVFIITLEKTHLIRGKS